MSLICKLIVGLIGSTVHLLNQLSGMNRHALIPIKFNYILNVVNLFTKEGEHSLSIKTNLL